MGDEKFVEQVEDELNEMQIREAVFGDVELPVTNGVEICKIEKAVAAKYGVSTELLHEHGRRAGVAKGVAIELCCMLSGKTQRAIAQYYGFKTDAGVSYQRRVLRQMTREDPKLRRDVRRLLKALTR
jgi:chromosomal replication initiation ATPase DnaA